MLRSVKKLVKYPKNSIKWFPLKPLWSLELAVLLIIYSFHYIVHNIFSWQQLSPDRQFSPTKHFSPSRSEPILLPASSKLPSSPSPSTSHRARRLNCVREMFVKTFRTSILDAPTLTTSSSSSLPGSGALAGFTGLLSKLASSVMNNT